MSRKIYYHDGPDKFVELPKFDLLTFLFESEYCPTLDETPLHINANYPSQIITKKDLRDLTERTAYGLRTNYGIGAKGPNKDVVTVISHGQPFVPVVFYGTLAAGGVYSGASPSSTVAELSRQIAIANSHLIICGKEMKEIALKAAKQCNLPPERVLMLESYPSFKLSSLEGNINIISNGKLTWQRITDAEALEKSIIVILWSSGTTGLPKGVMLSHTNLVSETYVVSLSGKAWVAREIAAGREVPPSRTLAHLPISHIAGIFGYLVVPFSVGGLVVWMGKYEWKNMLRFVKQYQITSFYTIASIYLQIAKSPDVTDHFKYVVNATTGAAPMDSKLQTAASKKLGGGGRKVVIGQTWGLSETTGAVTMMPRGVHDYTGCIGYILPNVELRMVDSSFNDVEPGQPGEFLVRGPMVTQGYYNNPQATENAFHDGWFCTGDIGIQRNGKFYIVDRKKELLKYKGQQIAPAEIEGVLISHPDIKDAAVCGVPSPEDPASDLPRAYVVADTTRVNEQTVKSFVKDRLSPFKQLRGGVVFVNEIPKNAVGKLLRRELKERAKKEMGMDRKHVVSQKL
ncbi:4-coumarate-CoA ligase [Histoplasma capsulatum var. duboisii H88]|uniref:4-coumarate-CoA ligase n=2 Tax=Ajellomyces capsulatus TaxID=5037 RepID=A0A8A1LKT9_AJEC8|nr:4-coumarate-CoA ligase [Histoplasma capsulatum H143]QSS54090.1 4-coumarate-CoA ligase [Histoplasma capsulatum var. duboisii H88]